MTFADLFNRRVRGFRIVELSAVGCLAVLVLCVYFFKAGAGRETARISDVDHQIADERRHVRLLKAEIAHLEQPERVERLSTSVLTLGPVQAKREASPDSLPELARQGTSASFASTGAQTALSSAAVAR